MVEVLDRATCVLFENDAQVEIEDRTVWVASSKHSFGGLGNLLINLWRLVVVQVAKLAFRPDVTISHLEGPNFANLLTWFGGRRIVFIHNRLSNSYLTHQARDKVLLALGRFLYKRADIVVAVSEGVKAELLSNFEVDSSKVFVLPNPIDIKNIRLAASTKYGNDCDRLCKEAYIVSVASLTEQKNHKAMLRLYAKIISFAPEFHQLKLVLLGEGPLKNQLQEECLQLGLHYFDGSSCKRFDQKPQVFFLGFQPNPYPLLSNARMLMMTSKWEGLPIALLEAMALGVPSAVTDCSESIREVFGVQRASEDRTSQGLLSTGLGILLPLDFDGSGNLENSTRMICDLIINPQARDRVTQNCVLQAEKYGIDSVSQIWREKLFEGRSP